MKSNISDVIEQVSKDPLHDQQYYTKDMKKELSLKIMNLKNL